MARHSAGGAAGSRACRFPLYLPAFLLLSACVVAPDAQAVFARERAAMVDRQLIRYGITDTATLRAMRTVPRHEFVPRLSRDQAYGDHPIPIGLGQTISQPYVVAYMTETVRPHTGMRVLEVGTGSGYQAAVLAEIGARVHTIEIFEDLANSARDRLGRLGYANVEVRHGDGFDGWPEAAPFEAILVTAASGFIPPPLIAQLAPGARLVIPVGLTYGAQHLILVEKSSDNIVRTQTLLPVRFVPLLRGLR
jgi:protein-L-isoaspartate(D-aspartate) O-methyltransferase